MLNNKKLIPVAAVPLIGLILLVAAMMSAGASPTQGVRVPPGAIVDSPNSRMANDTPPRPVPAAPALSPATQPGAVTEDFSGQALDAWQTTGDGPTTWVARDGRLQEDLPLVDGPSDQNTLFVTKDTKFTNGSIETELYATAGSPVGVVLRGSDQGYYRITLDMNVSTNTKSESANRAHNSHQRRSYSDRAFLCLPWLQSGTVAGSTGLCPGQYHHRIGRW